MMHNLDTFTYKLPTYYINLPVKNSDYFVELIFPIGPLSIKTQNPEIPHLLEHYLSSEIKKAGLTCISSSNLKSISFTTVFSEKNNYKKINLLLKTIFECHFLNEYLFQREKNILLNETLDNLSSPQELCNRIALNSFFEDTNPYLLNELEIKNTQLNNLSDYFQDYCKPENAQLFIGSSNFKQSEPNIPIVSAPNATPYPIKTSKTIQEVFLSKKSYINLSWPTLSSFEDPKEQIALYIISELLLSRDYGALWHGLLEEKGLIYSIEGHIDYYQTFGYFSLEFSIMPEDLKIALEIIDFEINKIKKGTIDPKFLHKITRENIQSTRKKWAENEGRFYWIMGDIQDRNRIYTLNEWLKLYSEVDSEYISVIANKYLCDSTIHKTIIK